MSISILHERLEANSFLFPCPLLQRRFEDALKKLQADLENKLEQRDEMKEQSRLKKAGIVPVREESEPNDDLFGENDEEEGNDMDLS